MAALYQAPGRPAAAAPLFARALAILEKSLPPGHPVTAAVRESYADLLDQLDRGEGASEQRTRAEAARQRHAQGRQPPPSSPSP